MVVNQQFYDRAYMNKLIIVLLIGVHLFLGIQTIYSLSPTYDEPVHLTAGYSFLKTGDYQLNGFANAPFSQMWAAIPLLVLRPSFPCTHPYWEQSGRYLYPLADIFLYQNRINAEKMLNSARTMILMLSVILGIVIYFWAKELFGPQSAIIALFLWCFAPFFIANGTLVTTDISLTLFYFASMYFLWKWKNQDNKTGFSSAFVGISIGLALISKHSAVTLLGVIIFILTYLYISGQINNKKSFLKDIVIAVIAILVIIAVIYRFSSPFEQYFHGLKKVLKEISSGRSTFLMGRYSTVGWLYYFPVVFAIKTPLSLIILLLFVPFCRKLWSQEKIFFLILPALFYFLISCFSKVQIGHRHILPVYPFLIVLVSGVFPLIKYKSVKIMGLLMLLWYGFGTVRNHPWHLSYFNELAGSPDNGYKYLTDSNVDWGQGLKSLGKYLREEKISGIYLSYFGTGDPHYYGIKYLPLGFIDNMNPSLLSGHRKGDEIDLKMQPRAIFVISTTNLQATYYADKNVFSSFKEINPEKIVARSILVYNLSDNPYQYSKLNKLIK